ncbi:hypothetical protein MK382_00120, partial [Streptococcus pneumoniae]|nr:hypothetical protein [Streptococcus pneumoniae]
DIERMPL